MHANDIIINLNLAFGVRMTYILARKSSESLPTYPVQENAILASRTPSGSISLAKHTIAPPAKRVWLCRYVSSLKHLTAPSWPTPLFFFFFHISFELW